MYLKSDIGIDISVLQKVSVTMVHTYVSIIIIMFFSFYLLMYLGMDTFLSLCCYSFVAH